MDKPIEEWKRRFRGMHASQIKNAWQAKAEQELSWTHECNFHAAAADRMRLLGNMAIDMDDDTRKKLCLQANSILQRLEKHLIDRPDKLVPIKQLIAESDEYFQKFGTRTARYYMYEQGMIDELGDRKVV